MRQEPSNEGRFAPGGRQKPCFHTHRGSQVKTGSSVAIVGLGGIGMNALSGANLTGAREIIAVDKIAPCQGSPKITQWPLFMNNSRGGVDYAFETAGVVSLQWKRPIMSRVEAV